jgi:hypothetical protein
MKSASSRRKEYVSGAADKDAAVLCTASLFLMPRTFSAATMTWCGHLRLRSERVISPLRLVIAEVSTFDLGGSLPILRHRRITLTAADESYSNSEPRPPPVALRVKQNGRSDEAFP